MSGSSVADNGVVSAVCTSFQSEEGKKLKEKLRRVAGQHGKKRQPTEPSDGAQLLSDGGGAIKAVSTHVMMNGAELPFLPGWPTHIQRDMYQAATPVLPPMSPSPSSHNPGGTAQVVDPRLSQMYSGGIPRELSNSSFPRQLPLQQQQQPQIGAVGPSVIPTSFTKTEPVNQDDGRKSMISNSNKTDISNYKNTSENILNYRNYSYISRTDNPHVSSRGDVLTAAHNAMLEKYKPSRQLSSPFSPVQNNQFQPVKSPFSQEPPNGYSGSRSRSVTPQLHRSISSESFKSPAADGRPEHELFRSPVDFGPSEGFRSPVDFRTPEGFKSPVDFRPENQIQTPYANGQAAKSADFWSQFGLLPPNISRKSPQSSSTAVPENQCNVDNSEKLMPKPKTTKIKRQRSVPNLDPLNQQPSYSNKTAGQAERKKDIKYSRKKKVDDPSIKELVDAKVQEIMAACREKESGGGKAPDTQPAITSPENSDYNGYNYSCEKQDLKVSFDHFNKNTTSSGIATAYARENETEKFQNKFNSKNGGNMQPTYQSSSLFSHQGQDFNVPEQQSQVTLHYKPASSGPKDHGHNRQFSLSEQVAEIRDKRKQSRSPTPTEFTPHLYYSKNNPDLSNNRTMSLSEQVTDVRNMRKERQSPSNLETPSDPQNPVPNAYFMNDTDLSYNKTLSLSEQVTDVRNMRKERHSPTNVDSIPQKEATDQNKSLISGRLSPCCSDCGKLGIMFSKDCQSRKNGKDITDPYNFSAFEEQHQQLLRDYKAGMYRNSSESSKASQNQLFNQDSSVFHDGKKSTVDQMGWSKVSATEESRKLDTEVKEFQSDDKVSDKSRQHKVSDDLNLKTKHHFTYLSDSYTKVHNLSVSDSTCSSSVSSNIQSTSVTTLPKFSSTWGSGRYDYSGWPQRQCASVQERSRLPATPALNLSQKKPGVKGKPGRKPRKEKAVVQEGKITENLSTNVQSLTLDSTPMYGWSLPSSKVTNLEPVMSESNAASKSENHSLEADSRIKSVEKSDQTNLFENAHDMDSTKIPLELDSRELESLGKLLDNRLPGDSGIGLEVDDDKLQSLPDGVSPEKVDKIKSQIESLKSMMTGDQEVHERLAANRVIDVPKCGCLGENGFFNEAVEGPYYTHLGAARSVKAVREILEKRTGATGKAIRIEKVRYTGKEGKSSQGCPIAKWIIRRSGPDEKYLCVVRHRSGHFCETAWLMIVLVAWEGVPTEQADDLYEYLCNTLPKKGYETERRCGTNERKTCACQGVDLMKRGASFSFGCSWSMYFNGCKFARSRDARKFKLKDSTKETVLEDKLQDLATHVGPLYKQMAPDAHHNQAYYSERASDCRLGKEPGGPFSGVTACVDFCAHAHKDIHNMQNGSTVVVTLTKHRGYGKPDDEQLHVLPLYVLEDTDENESYDGQCQKIGNGSLEVLHQYAMEARMRSEPLMSCKKRKALAKKDKEKLSPGKRRAVSPTGGRSSPLGSSSSTTSTPKKPRLKNKDKEPSLYSQDSNQSYFEGSQSSQGESLAGTPVKHDTQKQTKGSIHKKAITGDNKQLSYDELMAFSSQAGFSGLYNSFWNYFYTNGVFPPSSFLSSYSNSKYQTEAKKATKSVSESSAKESKIQLVSNSSMISQHKDAFSSSASSSKPSSNTSAADVKVPISSESGVSSSQDNSQNISDSARSSYESSNSGPFNASHHYYHSRNEMAANNSNSYSTKQHEKPWDVNKNGYIRYGPSHEPYTGGLNSESSYNQKESVTGQQTSSLTSGMGNVLDSLQTNIKSVPVEENKEEIKNVPDDTYVEDDSYIKDEEALDLSSSGNYKSFKNQLKELELEQRSENSNFPDYSNPSHTNEINQYKQNSNTETNIDNLRLASERSKMDLPYFDHRSSLNHQRCITNLGESASSETKTKSENFMMEKDLPNISKRFEIRDSVNSNGHFVSQDTDKTVLIDLDKMMNTSQESATYPPPAYSSPHINSQQYNAALSSENQVTKDNSNISKVPEFKSRDHNSSDVIRITNPFDSPTKDVGSVNYNFQSFSEEFSRDWFGQGNEQIKDCVDKEAQVSDKTNSSTENKATVQGEWFFKKEDNCFSKAQQSNLNKFSAVESKINQPNNCSRQVNENSKSSDSNMTQAQINPQVTTERTYSTQLFSPADESVHNNSSKLSETSNSQAKVETKTSTDFSSPLHLLSEAVEIRSKDMQKNSTAANQWQNNNYNQNRDSVMNNHFPSAYQSGNQNQFKNKPVYQSRVPPPERSSVIDGYRCNPDMLACNEQLSLNMPKHPAVNGDENSCIDPTVIKCEMEYNENAFHDPLIGGVAVALCHGAVLFEVAKRELHATTGLRNPDRYHPTRISLVFYQHKNLNYAEHGWHVYAKKLEDMKRQRIAKMQEERGSVDMEEIENSFKGGKKKKRKIEDEKEEEKIDFSKTSAAKYKYMWDSNVKFGQAQTTNTISTKWINPEPMVSGPYQKWV